MLGSDILDVAIGMTFVYFLLSLLSVTIAELIARIFALRSGTLVDAIRNLLADDGLNKDFWDHPVIKKLAQGKGGGIGQGNHKPSYIPANQFALVLLDIIRAKVNSDRDQFRSSDEVRDAVKAPEINEDLRKLLLTLLGVNVNIESVHLDLARWFDDYMDRVSGWYKRKSQTINLVLGLALALMLNVDSLAIFNSLSTDPALRAAAVEVATKYVNDQSPPIQTTQPVTVTQTVPDLNEPIGKILELERTLAQLNLPLSWAPADEKIPVDLTGWFYKIAGLLITALLVSLGAPFWFDLLTRFVSLRSSGKAPPKTPEAEANPPGGDRTRTGNDVPKPVTEKPPPGDDLAGLADKALQYVDGVKAGGRPLTREREDEVALRFMQTEAEKLGLVFTDPQLSGALHAARERRGVF
jgi:hypothetical protein